MPKVNLHFRRFEFKYHLHRSTADSIIPALMRYMLWDDYSKDSEGYDVYSLYFDSPEFRSYHEKLDGIMNRKKLRIRAYQKDFDNDNDLFFELKRRSGEVVLKDRIPVKGTDFKKFINNTFCLSKEEKYQGKFLNEFLYELAANRMQPKILINYKRKPFFSKFDKRFRVTFDYDLAFSNFNGENFDGEKQTSHEDLVIMEVKFNGAVPKWFHNVIELHSLQKDSFSKYCAGIETLYGLPSYF